jgi:hypothetical protein
VVRLAVVRFGARVAVKVVLEELGVGLDADIALPGKAT